MNKMKEADLKIYDVWKSPNGHLFIKITDDYSIAIGAKGFHDPNTLDLERTQYAKADDTTPVKKVGKIKFKKDE
jgi:hypothetical protein